MTNVTSQYEPVPAPAGAGSTAVDGDLAARPKRGPRSVWATIRAGIGAALGILPHVMHHIGLLAGAALLTGVLGNGILYVVGLLMSIPLLRRLRSRFQTMWAPAIGVAVFTTLFSLSAFVVGPAISGAGSQSPAPTPTPAVTTTDGHDGHH
ncbi:MAG: hypothetical protein L0H79_12455 [Intrasporangium sp.]|uniref:hypothetical protein n=1 Tax=Intrasporangium sp. TaxID=1925024 RepID=UPI0026473810|nr:hypothetical protein [Intrasporangium sp.]MDN5796551.1 hypothetical protein [Intrasporangium sp.]